jgi:translation elongation factor EF-Tu-like GTPase
VVSGHSFKMTIEDVFDIADRGVVVTGTVETGSVQPGDEVTFESKGARRSVRVTAIEKFREMLPRADAGDSVGLYLSDVAKDDVAVGDRLVTA